MPIVGDPKYGKKSSAGMLLHCYKLILPELTLTLAPKWKGRFAVDQSLLS
jgi:23S rRNA-/tRNA-specific pseudouridylate synthase